MNQPKKMNPGVKKFYVGSNNLAAHWTHATLAAAVRQATRMIEKNGYEEVFVVEIKHIVRRKTQPVVVEVV